MLLSANLVGFLHVCIHAYSNILPYHKQMQVQQENKGGPDRSHDSHVNISSLLSANLYKVGERRILRSGPSNLHDDMSATYYNNDHLQFLGMSYAFDLL